MLLNLFWTTLKPGRIIRSAGNPEIYTPFFSTVWGSLLDGENGCSFSNSPEVFWWRATAADPNVSGADRFCASWSHPHLPKAGL